MVLLFSCLVTSSYLQSPWTAACQIFCPLASPRACSTHAHCVNYAINHLVPCHPLLLPSIFPSISVFSSELAFPIRWLKYWSFSFSISHSNEYSELISFRIDCFDLLAVQGTLKSLLSYNHIIIKYHSWRELRYHLTQTISEMKKMNL